MSWWKVIVIGCCAYWLIFFISFLLFVQFGLGYSFPKLSSIIAEILAFPTTSGKNYNIFFNMVFWSILIAGVIKFLYFIASCFLRK